MFTPSNRGGYARWHTVLDVVVILAISLVAEGAHLSVRQGRAILCGDSAQHADGAEALLSDDKTPNFGFRKPGYTLILAGILALTGEISWHAIVLNHLLLALLPAAAYGLGYNLHSRVAGWVAALFTIAQLQGALWGGRIMTEASYTCVMTFGVLAFAVGLNRRRVGAWMIAGGVLLAYAWLIRAIGIAVIVAAVGVLVWSFRRERRRALTLSTCLLMPLVAAVLVECGLNLKSSGRFRTSTASLGIMLQNRARYLLGLPFPDTETTRWFLDLLPERDPESAYLANKLDGCVARHRAIRDRGMDEWTFDAVAVRSGIETLAAAPKAYLKSGAEVFVRHLLRRNGGPSLSGVPPEDRLPIIVHEAAPSFRESQEYWYAYWFLPHRSVDESTALVARMREAAEKRAPFGRSPFWDTFRYLSTLPVVVDTLGVIRGVASLWPGFALIFCGLLGLNRRTCGLLACAYVLEALIIAVCGSTDVANERYQFVWLATDTALAACLVTPVIRVGAAHVARLWARPQESPPKAAGASI
ncbi:MAG: glycosyltransferase family 39 protein [Phycisphaerales bacterium]|nr:MAG: glycosyltransferase family 39 protein [Phycisphaerales bacterium]